ncbi:unnamed protein product, partial [Prorocentrum cordatum]
GWRRRRRRRTRRRGGVGGRGASGDRSLRPGVVQQPSVCATSPGLWPTCAQHARARARAAARGLGEPPEIGRGGAAVRKGPRPASREPPGRATDRKRPAPNNKEDAAVQGGAGLWEAPLRELGEVPPRAGDPAAPEKHHRHAWVERPAARKTAREEEQLSRQVGICRLQQNAPPPPPKNCTHRQRKRSGVRASLVGHT